MDTNKTKLDLDQLGNVIGGAWTGVDKGGRLYSNTSEEELIRKNGVDNGAKRRPKPNSFTGA